MRGSISKNILRYALDLGTFRVCYVITLLFEMIAFLDVFSLAMRCAVLSWGVVIFIYNFLIIPRAFQIKYKWLIWLFILVGIITSLVNMSVDFWPNMVFVYHTCVCMFIFFGMYMERDLEKIESEMIFILKFFVIFAFIFSFFSIVILIFRAQISIGSYYLGIFGNRLIGVYTNSNLLAFSMVVSIVSCDVLTDRYIRDKCCRKVFPVWFINCSRLFSFISLFLSDSNDSFLFIVIYFTVRMFYNIFSNYNKFNLLKLIRGSMILIVCAIFMLSVSFFARNICQKAIGIILNDVHKVEEPVSDDNNDILPSKPSINSYIPDIKIGRNSSDVSSGRITLFRQGLIIFKANPLIGIGRGNLLRFSEKYIEGGLCFSDLHNSYLTILVSYGTIGFAVFLMFSIAVAFEVCTFLFQNKDMLSSGVFSKFFAMIISYCVYALFEKAILSEITFMVVFFWYILGFAVSYIYKRE